MRRRSPRPAIVGATRYSRRERKHACRVSEKFRGEQGGGNPACSHFRRHHANGATGTPGSSLTGTRPIRQRCKMRRRVKDCWRAGGIRRPAGRRSRPAGRWQHRAGRRRQQCLDHYGAGGDLQQFAAGHRSDRPAASPGFCRGADRRGVGRADGLNSAFSGRRPAGPVRLAILPSSAGPTSAGRAEHHQCCDQSAFARSRPQPRGGRRYGDDRAASKFSTSRCWPGRWKPMPRPIYFRPRT